MARFKKPYSLSWHLVALVLAAMIPFFIFYAIMVDRLVDLERESSERSLRRAAQRLRFSVDQEFTATIRTLQALAGSAKLRRHDLKSFYEDLVEIKKTQPSWEAILVHSPDGKPLISTIRNYGEELILSAEPDSIKSLLATGQPTIGKIVRAPPGRGFADKLAAPIRVPVFDKEEIIYVLSAIITVDPLQRIVTESPAPEEWTRAIVDSSGTVVARSRSPEAFVGQPATQPYQTAIRENLEGFIRTATLEGKKVYVAYDRSPFSDWTASVAVPIAVLEEPARLSKRIVVTTGTLLILFFGGSALFYSRRLVKQIKSATTGAIALAEGKVPEVEQSMVSEVEQLRESLLTASKLLQLKEQERSEHLKQANSARTEAERANRAKSEFLANMSHELRTPLGVVLGFSELIASVDCPPEERAEALEIIQRNGQHLLRLIDDILDLAKVEARKISLESVDFSLPDLISGIAAELKPKATDKGIELIITSDEDVPENVKADPVRLRQIIYNILGNAIKFTKQGEVSLHLSADDSHLVLTIRDTGIGLDGEQQKVLFQSFSQADSSHTRKFGGTGLGLALSKRLAELMGGDVQLIESKPGQGSTFQIRVRVKP